MVVEILILRRWALGNQLASFNYLTIFIALQLTRLLTKCQMTAKVHVLKEKKNSAVEIYSFLCTQVQSLVCALRRMPADKPECRIAVSG